MAQLTGRIYHASCPSSVERMETSFAVENDFSSAKSIACHEKKLHK
ncbi:hypothetical protein Cabys_1410 [Caldithrix abyssi DSM 13497]|uniref:Uncharacterized protein n=1 Tax=Caldithrix abyssi DSM 13497 TaxID=880073 RepID=A0A1J1C688_CALAY|nr:hypothetical protein Cabys_1410 [Caldithrix abyssi DSM 13497]